MIQIRAPSKLPATHITNAVVEEMLHKLPLDISLPLMTLLHLCGVVLLDPNHFPNLELSVF